MLFALFLVLFAATGCATQNMIVRSPETSDATFQPAVPDPFPPMPSQNQNMMPRLVIPSTGGPPVIGIPIGGDLYIPVTGGAPIPGMPIGP
jgi:hypothetical protein